MTSERIRRQIERLLDGAEVAANADDWSRVFSKARAVLAIDEGNEDAAAYLKMAEANLGGANAVPAASAASPLGATPATAAAHPAEPESFAGGRYRVVRLLGEGGKKKVYLAHDALLDRDVAFALIKTDGLDETGRKRVLREAQAMGRLGAHPHIVSIYDLGQADGQPYVVTELLAGGDVEALLAEGPPPLERALAIASGVARGLEYAHAQGILHRDLKPGNVWLTSSGPDGVAKLGDFGLALTLGRSRLTGHGMMVGTYHYMPPEQALGGEATPKSDLYSLGCLLYELVTGRTPFQGDAPTAVISQHLNTRPVAPSWHTPHCPPALEDLILQLLEKDPHARPASAAAVVEALAKVDPAEPSRSHADAQANPLERLARGVFVGREDELRRLRDACDLAFQGRGSVVMLVGEPGIGKTRTVQELETYARLRGATVLWGRAHESAGAPPYFPWVQIGRAYAAVAEDGVLTSQLRDHAVELQRLFPGVRQRFPDLPEPPALDSEEAQFRLFDAYTAFFRSVSEATPLLLVLDDLHWADRATLQLLAHIARELGRARILVAGTYRDTDLDRQHPLARTLAELNREQLFLRIPLQGLTRDEVGAYIGAVAGLEPPARLVDRVHEETEGNPFFLAEVVNLMTQEGALQPERVASVSDVAIPEGVKEALGRRLDRLSSEANELLTLAAVLGREFDHSQLLALASHDDDTLLRLVEEALAARVLEETGRVGEYRFTHALMQETLLGELSAARRVRLHGQIAEALERLYGDTADAHAPELARHYAESAMLNRQHARAAAKYLRLAAEQAAGALAFEESASHYERCLGLVGDAPDRLGQHEAALWAELAVALGSSGDVEGLPDALRHAFDLDTDPNSCARLLMRVRAGTTSSVFYEYVGIVDEVVARLEGFDSPEACAVLALRGALDDGAEGDVAHRRALDLADRLGLTTSRRPVELYERQARLLMERGAFDEVAELSEAEYAREIANGTAHPVVHTMLVFSALLKGDIAQHEQRLGAATEAARSAGNRAFESATVGIRTGLLRRRGDRSGAWDLVRRSGTPTVNLRLESATLDAEAGRLQEAWDAISDPALLSSSHGTNKSRLLATRARLLTLLGHPSARAAYDAWWPAWKRTAWPTPNSTILGVGSDALLAFGDDGALRDAAGTLARLPSMRCWQTAGLPDELRGYLSLRFGKLQEAEQHFRTGLEWALKPDVRFEVDAGRCLQGLAEVAERRGDIETARAHLDAAGVLFARHGAKLYLDQVIAKKQILRA